MDEETSQQKNSKNECSTKKDFGDDSEPNYKELPIEIDMDISHSHHSIIICPITNEICDLELNRPMLLSCGHVVSENSVGSITKNFEEFGEENVYLKCPTCPNKTKLNTLRPLKF